MSIRTVGQKESSIRRFVKDVIAYFDYELYRFRIKKMSHEIKVMSIDETIDELKNTEKSLVRFGDGEIAMMRGVSLKLQKQAPELVSRMKDIVGYREDNLMISVPDIFEGLDMYRKSSRQFWRDHLLFCRRIYESLCNPDRVYCSTSFSRCYMTIEDKSKCGAWFDKIRDIWANKDVVIVEGSASHIGADNDLLSKAKSVERIICPPHNAYDAYGKILDACKEYDHDRLFLLALGATAKPLAEDLFHEGYRVIDIGNLDMEYCWFISGATEKKVLEKHSIVTKEDNLKAGFDEYLNEIKVTIL